jgi:hypothetical protein
MILALVGLCCRPERAGVTSLVRLFGFGSPRLSTLPAPVS